MPLTTHSASLSTATAQIQTLIVAGQRLTMAVFRQLRERPLISDDDGVTLNGKPWGVVEYHPTPKTCPKGEHLHVIWAHGSTLLRDTIAAPDVAFAEYHKPRHGAAYLNAMVRDRIASGPTDLDGSRDRAVTVDGVRVRLPMTDEASYAIAVRKTLDGVLERAAQQRIPQDSWGCVAYTAYLPRRAGRGIEQVSISLSAGVRYHWYQLDEAIARLGDEPTEDAWLRLAGEVEKERSWRRMETSVYRKLADLPQLFIAA